MSTPSDQILEEILKEQRNNMGTLAVLPDEILIEILSKFNPTELSTVKSISKYFEVLTNDNELWRRFAQAICQQAKLDPETHPGMTYKQLYYDLKNKVYLKELFLKEYPEAVLQAPAGKITILPSSKKELQTICATGKEEQLKKRLPTLVKELKFGSANDHKELVNLISLCLNNKICKNAFKIFMESIQSDLRIYALNYIYDAQYYYITLHYLLNNIQPCEVEKDMPLIMTIIKASNNDLSLPVFRLIKFLIAYDEKSLLAADGDKETPFHSICNSSNVSLDLIKYFATEVVKCNTQFILAVDLNGKTPLHCLTERSFNKLHEPEKVQSFFDSITALIQACPQVLIKPDKNNKTIIENLVCNSFFVDNFLENFWDTIEKIIKNLTKDTLLISCLRMANSAVIPFIDKFLEQSNKKDKAYINYSNREGNSALHFCSQFLDQKVCMSLILKLLLLEADAKRFNIGTVESGCCQNIAVTRLLLKAGANPNTGMGLMHAACRENNKELVELLMQYKFNPNSLDENGFNSLYYAVTSKNEDTVALLLENGADKNIAIHGKPILNIALENNVKLQIIEILLKHNADPTVSDINGQSALELSKKQNCTYEIRNALKNAARKLGYSLPTKVDIMKQNENLKKENEALREQLSKTLTPKPVTKSIETQTEEILDKSVNSMGI